MDIVSWFCTGQMSLCLFQIKYTQHVYSVQQDKMFIIEGIMILMLQNSHFHTSVF